MCQLTPPHDSSMNIEIKMLDKKSDWHNFHGKWDYSWMRCVKMVFYIIKFSVTIMHWSKFNQDQFFLRLCQGVTW
jgi:hypothetical protein